jgi:hypothetical protein
LSKSADVIFQRERNSVAESSFYVKSNQRSQKLFHHLAHTYDGGNLTFYSLLLKSKNKLWKDCTNSLDCIDSQIATIFRHHNVFHCPFRPIIDFDPCKSDRFLFLQPLCSHTLDFKINLLKDYNSWLLTDCHKNSLDCERAPASWILQRRPLECLKTVADLGWEGGEETDGWDDLKGERYDKELLREYAGGKQVVALREGANGTQIVGVLD